MVRGLAAPLSPNEEITLWRVHEARKLADLDMRHVKHLVALALVSLDDGAPALTVLGKRRIDKSLSPARVAAQKIREAGLFGNLGLAPPPRAPKALPKR